MGECLYKRFIYLKNFNEFLCIYFYGTPLLSYYAANALYGVVISIYLVVKSIYCVVISICDMVISIYDVVM